MTNKKKIGAVILTLLFLDILGFIAWSLSGQIPADGFYIGIITKAVLSFIF